MTTIAWNTDDTIIHRPDGSYRKSSIAISRTYPNAKGGSYP